MVDTNSKIKKNAPENVHVPTKKQWYVSTSDSDLEDIFVAYKPKRRAPKNPKNEGFEYTCGCDD